MAGRKPWKGIAMEGMIARWYAKNTARDVHRFDDKARAILERLRPSGRILEVAPGPGYFAVMLARAGRRVAAVDISRSFISMIRENAARAGVTIDVRHGDAAALPFGDDSFDYVVCMAAFKNFTNPLGALNEMYRVLTPGGEASIYDLRKDASLEEIDRGVRDLQLSRWNAWLTRLIFRYGLLRAAYTREQLERLAAESRFGRCEITARGIELELRLTR